MDWLALPMMMVGGMIRAQVRSLVIRALAFAVMAIVGLGFAIYAAANGLYGVTPSSLPVLILFTVWFVGTIVALAWYVRSERRQWRAASLAAKKPPVAPTPQEAPLVHPRKREPGPRLGERARYIVPWAGTLLAAIPLAVLSLLAGAMVADPLEAAGVPNSVTFPLGLLVMCATFAVGVILVFRRLWSRSPVARARNARAEARRQWIHDLDAHLAPPPTTSERSEGPPIGAGFAAPDRPSQP
jgi:hypothetical protein